MYNSADWSSGEGDLAAYHVPADTDTAEARVALMEKTVEVSRYFLEFCEYIFEAAILLRRLCLSTRRLALACD